MSFSRNFQKNPKELLKGSLNVLLEEFSKILSEEFLKILLEEYFPILLENLDGTVGGIPEKNHGKYPKVFKRFP